MCKTECILANLWCLSNVSCFVLSYKFRGIKMSYGSVTCIIKCVTLTWMFVRCPVLPEDVLSTWSDPETQQLPVPHLLPQQRQTHRWANNTTHIASPSFGAAEKIWHWTVFVSGPVFTLGESGRSESRTTLRSPKEERPDIMQLRKVTHHHLTLHQNWVFIWIKNRSLLFIWHSHTQSALCQMICA